MSVSGCASSFSPRPIDEVPFKARVQTQVDGGLKVTAAVPTREEATSIYGVDLAAKGMQPVWVQVENGEADPYWFITTGLDPGYFSATEAAYPFRSSASGDASRAIDGHFRQLQFKNPIPAKSTVSGFVIVNHDEAFKAVDIDLVTQGKSASFTYIFIDPSFKGDYTLVDFATIYDDSQTKDFEQEVALRQVLEELPCCTTNEDGSEQGDPLNLVLVGDTDDIFPAFIRRGWHGTEILWSKAMWRTITSFLQGSRYRYSPISPLYVYARRQDLSMQKARGTIHERNHLRLWMTPLRFRGKPVWIGQISRDIGVKFTLKSPTISTHVIDPDVDEARRYLTQDLAYSQALARIGYVQGVGEVGKDAPRMNLVGDPYYTDGLRVVMFFDERPRTLREIEYVWDWEVPPPRRGRAVKASTRSSQ